jgi:hypothetical protein
MVDGTLARPRRFGPARDFLLSDLATRWIADGNLRAVPSVSFPRAHDLAQPRFTLLMPGIDHRVFRFTCIAELCNG